MLWLFSSNKDKNSLKTNEGVLTVITSQFRSLPFYLYLFFKKGHKEYWKSPAKYSSIFSIHWVLVACQDWVQRDVSFWMVLWLQCAHEGSQQSFLSLSTVVLKMIEGNRYALCLSEWNLIIWEKLSHDKFGGCTWLWVPWLTGVVLQPHFPFFKEVFYLFSLKQSKGKTSLPADV